MASYERHPFSRSILKQIKQHCTLDNWHGLAALLEDYAVIAAAVAAPYLLAPSLGWWLPYCLISLPLIGSRMRALATLLHESAHKCLARNRILNYALGTCCSGWLIAQSWFAYYRSHVLRHHVHLGTEADPDINLAAPGKAPWEMSRARFIWNNLISPLLLVKTPGKLVDLIRHRLWARDVPWQERAGQVFWVGGLSTALCLAGLGRELLLFWLCPYLLVFPIVNWYIELLEHLPLREGERRVDLYMTRNRWMGPVGQFFLGMHNEHLHLVHHLFPSVPFWRQPQVHRLLMQDDAYRTQQLREVGLLFPVVDGVSSLLLGLVPEKPEADEYEQNDLRTIA